MEPVLIYKDEEKIEQEKQYLVLVIDYLQGLYNKFNAIGISVTLKELNDITGLLLKAGTTNAMVGNDYLTNFVADKLLEMAGTPNFNGIAIQRSKLREMLELPDLSPIRADINKYSNWRNGEFEIKYNLLVIQDGIIAKAAYADTKLEAAYSHYTKTEKSRESALKLKTLCSALQDWRDFEPGSSRHYGYGEEVMPGIIYNGSKFVTCVKFIRHKEQLEYNNRIF